MIEGVKKSVHKAEEASVVVEVIPGGKRETGQKSDKQGSLLRTLRSGIAMDMGLSVEDRAEDAAVKEAVEKLKTRYGYRFIKRLFDISFSLIILVTFSWLFFVVALAIKIDDPKGPIIFKQKRVAKDGKEFDMYKFRSMCVDAEEHLSELKELNEKTGPVFKMHNDPRITRVGKVIRKLSIDEMPQFVNVLKGDMSTVGPRPALPSEAATYSDYQCQRLLVKPGMTCYWQTRRNRDSITFDEWVDLDLLYIRKCSVWVDFKLIIQTVGCVLTAQGS